MKSSLSKGISLRNSRRKRRSLGKRRYTELEDKKDYVTKYNIKYETIEKKVKEKKKPKIRSIKITYPKPNSSKEVSSKEVSSKEVSSKEVEMDLLALLDDNVFKKESKGSKGSTKESEELPEEEEKDNVKQEGGYDPDVKKIFVKNLEPEGDKPKLVL